MSDMCVSEKDSARGFPFEVLDMEKINKLEYALWKRTSMSIPEVLDFLALEYEEEDEDEMTAQSNLSKDLLLEDLKNLNTCYKYEVIKFEENHLSFNTDNNAYIFCVIAAHKGAGHIEDVMSSDDIGKVFEYITLEALKQWKGTYSFERHENFHEDIHNICDKLNIVYSKSYCDDDVASTVKDGGVDVVGYCPTSDTACLRGHIYLVQCASGRNYRSKDKDIDNTLWDAIFKSRPSKVISIVDFWVEKNLKYSASKLPNIDEVFDRRHMFIDTDVFKDKYPQEHSDLLKFIGHYQ